MNDLANLRGFVADELNDAQVAILEGAARRARAHAVVMTSVAASGHPAGALSSMDLFVTVLASADFTPELFGGTHDRDHIVVSHGHTSAGWYAALGLFNFLDVEEALAHFRQAGSPYQGHVERGVPGVDWGTGNLGQGLSAGVGFAIASRALGHDRHTYVLMGDGEQVKGQIAEARRVAHKRELGNITAVVDWNNIQISGTCQEIMPADLRALWEADGFKVYECDGHDYNALYKTLKEARNDGVPSVVLAKTVMGKGVSFMENKCDFHGKAAVGGEIAQALGELGEPESLYAEAKNRRFEALPQEVLFLEEKVELDLGQPITYEADARKDNRGAFGAALADVAGKNKDVAGRTPILAFDCDLAGSVKLDAFARVAPERFIQAGIQEHNVATLVGAASVAGVVPVWADFGVFGIDEAYNQQRLNDTNRANAKLVLTHVGLDVGEDGMTHQCIDYVSLLRNCFGWKLVVPADPNQTDLATRWLLTEPGNICLAMGRSVLPIVTKDDGTPFFGKGYTFKYGGIDVIRKGADVNILAMGHMVSRALAAREILRREKIDAQVLHCACPLAMNVDELLWLMRKRPLVTCEDHHVDTGMGAIVAMNFGRKGKSVPMVNMGVTRYGDSGSAEDVLFRMKLAPEDIARSAKELVATGGGLAR